MTPEAAAREALLHFGPEGALAGVWCEPPGDPPAVAALLVNAGVIHRIGPHRLNVKLARALARAGVPSLRFDLAGRGDNLAAAAAPAGATRRNVADLQSAMDHLERERGIRRFVAIGLCSGAVDAYELALADKRVVGLEMFDGFIYITPRARLRYLVQRAASTPARALPGKLARWLGAALGRGAVPAPSVWAHRVPSRDEFAATMSALLDRGVGIRLAFSGSHLDKFNDPQQLVETFGAASFAARIECAYLPEVDHTVTLLGAQRTVIDGICRWAAGVAARS